jgi:hypothetical protein
VTLGHTLRDRPIVDRRGRQQVETIHCSRTRLK